ncbi:serine/threonine protein kinase [Actinoplanes sp. NPDC049265]|uniref:serine/threonine protein kinase n=1 Tax=Actinoplanes sp. NPDC049265 TaxID=3363902 RepID=UPI0037189500
MDQDRTSSSSAPGVSGYGASTLDLSGRCVGSSYILVRPLGQGATGTVWRGVDRSSGQPVAVKLLHESLLRQPKLVTRFVQERTILMMLRHRNVVRVRDLFSVGESLGLVMDLVPGGSLRDHLREHHTIAAGEAARLAGQLAAALAEAHGLNVIHRDLKPDNILLQTEDGRLETRLTDFGIARVLNMPSITTPNAVVGTPHYMSPEAFHGAPASPAADIYALGITLYEMVTGRPPYSGDSVHELMQRHLAGGPERPDGLPDQVWAVIGSCLEQKPRLRPTSEELVAELADVARAVAGAPKLPAPTSAAPDLPSRPPAASPSPFDPAALPPAASPSPFDLPALPPAASPSPFDLPRLSLVPEPRVPKRPLNKAASWRWRRPGTVLTVLVGTMLASGVATTAWHVTRSGASAADIPVSASVPSVAFQRPSPAPSTPVARETSAPPAPPRARKATSPAAEDEPGDPVRPSTTAKPAATRKPQPEARPYGPWNCRQVFSFDMSNPLAIKPCQSVGKAVQMSGSVTAASGGYGSISVALVESGRTVAGPYTCSNLEFTRDDTTQECGPRTVAASRGHTYTVRVAWSFSREGKMNNGSASGEAFTF